MTRPSPLLATSLGAVFMLGTLYAAQADARRPRPKKEARQAAVEKPVMLDVRVIEARQGKALKIDKRLKPLGRDLKSLPFKEFTLVDSHKKTLAKGARMSFQFPGPGKKDERFLVVTNKGERSGKLQFLLEIKALKFRTSVSVRNGGTIVVGGPRSRGGGNLMFAVTARQR